MAALVDLFPPLSLLAWCVHACKEFSECVDTNMAIKLRKDGSNQIINIIRL